MLIAVEGMDGVGKTVISRHISKKYGYLYIDKPLHFFYEDGPENDYADLMRVANRMYDVGDNMIKSWYFSLGNLYVARKFQDRDVVVDRHLVSNYYWNGDTDSEPIFESLIQTSGVPDLTVLLYATPKTRMVRLKARNEFDPDLTDPDKLDDGYQKMMYFMEKFHLPYIVIDTENKSVDEVEAMVDSEIDELIKNKKNQKILQRERKVI